MPKPAFLTDGNTTTHSALSKRSLGIPFSGIPMISFRTSADSLRRSSSFFCPSTDTAQHRHIREVKSIFIAGLLFSRSNSQGNAARLSGPDAAHPHLEPFFVRPLSAAGIG